MPANDFQSRFKAFWDALQGGDSAETRRVLDDIARLLDGMAGGGAGVGGASAPLSPTRTSKVPQQLLDRTAVKTQSPLNAQASTKGQGVVEGKQTSFDTASGHPLRKALVADGEGVTPYYGVCVRDNVAYLCDGTDTTRKCDGVCERGTGKSREIFWRPQSGTVIARVKRDTGVTEYGPLYVSITPGVFTNNPDEAGLAFVQQVGHFKGWVNPQDGSQPDLAEISLSISGAGSGGGGGGSNNTTGSGTAGEAIATGDLVCVDYTGLVWLADGGSQWRYCTAVATSSGGEGDTVSFATVGVFDIKTDSDNPYLHTSTFYLSATTPGAASPTPPGVSDGSKMWQQIGYGIEERDAVAGTTKIEFSPQVWTWV